MSEKTSDLADVIVAAVRLNVERAVARALEPVLARLAAVESAPTPAGVSEDTVLRMVGDAVAALPRAKDGESVHPDTVRVMVQEAVAGLPPPPAGKDADPAEMIKAVSDEVQRQFDAIRPLIKGEKGDPGAGLTDMDMEIREDGRTLVFRFVGADSSKEFEVVAPWQIYRGVWKADTYSKGDVVTYAGSSWTALKDAGPEEKPSSSDAWQLSVKKGKDA